jgi:hypothetical protein
VEPLEARDEGVIVDSDFPVEDERCGPEPAERGDEFGEPSREVPDPFRLTRRILPSVLIATSRQPSTFSS